MFLYILIFLFGLVVGSFLNVVICRLETGEKIINDRSRCPHCRKTLEWYDLVPLLSFLALRGKCRYCKKPISLQYPLVEFATGVLFILVIWTLRGHSGQVLNFGFVSDFGFRISDLFTLFYLLFITSTLIVIFVYDLKHYIIPDKIVYPAIGITFFYLFFKFLNFEHLNLFWILDFGFWIYKPIFNNVLAAIIASGFFLSIVILTRGAGMGIGDVKLAFLMGLILGWPNILLALFAAFTIGAIFGIILIALKKKTLKSIVPFGPFLVIGTFLGIFWGQEILDWYFNFLI